MSPRARAAAAAGSRRLLERLALPQVVPLTDQERASYADTAVCRAFGHRPSHYRRDDDGTLVLVLEPPPVEGSAP